MNPLFWISRIFKNYLRILIIDPENPNLSLIDQFFLENTNNCPPYWIRLSEFSEFSKTDYRFMIIDPKNIYIGLLPQTWFENRNNRLPNWIRYFEFSEFSLTDFRFVISDSKNLYMELIDQICLENTDNCAQYLIQQQNLKSWLTKTINFSIHYFDLQFLTR